MRKTLVLCACLALWMPGAAGAADTWGDLIGKFVVEGTAPPKKKLNADKDVEVCAKHELFDESLVVGSAGELANVVLYVSSKKVKIHPDLANAGATAVVYDNKDCRFEPHILPVMVGQEVKIHNSDPVGHNSNVTPLLNPAFNQLIPSSGETAYKFQKAERLPVKVACNVHAWMSGYMVVRDNPYTVISAADGTFTIKNLPAGEELEFQAWQEKSGYLSLATPKWEKGKFKMKLKPGVNDLGVIKVPASLFAK